MQCIKTANHINITVFKASECGTMHTLLLFFLFVIRGGSSKPALSHSSSETAIQRYLTPRHIKCVWICSSTISADLCYFTTGIWRQSVYIHESREYMFMEARNACARSKGTQNDKLKFLVWENILASVATVSME